MSRMAIILISTTIAFAQIRLPDGVLRYDKPGPAPGFWQYVTDNWGWVINSKPFGKSVAFLVGVGDYTTLRPKLKYVGRDLEDMRRFLLEQARFDTVYVAQDGTASAGLVERYMMTTFPTPLNKEDRLLFYFSGHGADVAGTGYMQFIGATGDYDRAQYLEVTQCERWSKALKAKHALFLIDACNSGLGYDAKEDAPPQVDQKLLSSFSGDGSRIVITAGTGTEC